MGDQVAYLSFSIFKFLKDKPIGEPVVCINLEHITLLLPLHSFNQSDRQRH